MKIKRGENCATERLNKMRSLVTLARPVPESGRHVNLVMLEKGEMRGSGVNECRRWYQGNEFFITHKSKVILMASHLNLYQILLSCSGMSSVFDTHIHSISFFITVLYNISFSSNYEKIRNNNSQKRKKKIIYNYSRTVNE